LFFYLSAFKQEGLYSFVRPIVLNCGLRLTKASPIVILFKEYAESQYVKKEMVFTSSSCTSQIPNQKKILETLTFLSPHELLKTLFELY